MNGILGQVAGVKIMRIKMKDKKAAWLEAEIKKDLVGLGYEL